MVIQLQCDGKNHATIGHPFSVTGDSNIFPGGKGHGVMCAACAQERANDIVGSLAAEKARIDGIGDKPLTIADLKTLGVL